jgi:hypothetical protein
MGKDQIDDRLKLLFSELGCHIEPLDGLPLTVNPKDDLNTKKALNSFPDKKETESICPFLKTAWDDTIRYGYPHQDNLCYKSKKAQSISLSDQKEVCLSRHFGKCLVYLESKNEGQIKNIFIPLFNFIQR